MAEAVTRVAIALGSNLGDRRRHLTFAIDRIAHRVSGLRVSRFIETDPVGVGEQPRFLNGVVTGETMLPPHELLDALLGIERDALRERPWPGAPRTLDLDLILYGDAVIHDTRLTVPHPRFRERQFVLEPLAELAPDWLDPGTGRTVAALWQDLQETSAGKT
jgi:2-amino-4-hydroxy-6-hydroxymethyldihydropteridine diphosphokinase